MAKLVAACVVFFAFMFWASHGVTRGLVVFAAFLLTLAWFTQHRKIPFRIRRPETPHAHPLIHVDARMGVRPAVLGHAVPVGYRLACLYFGSGLIDRTRTLDHGFPYTVLDPIPELPTAGRGPSLADLVSERAEEIVAAAQRRGVPIRVLWSGGIDSTVAACALLRALGGDSDRLEICHTSASRHEYLDFFYDVVKPHLRRRKVRRITDALDPGSIAVTGECGDQLFGNVKVIKEPLERLRRPWEDEFPRLLSESLASPQRVDAMIRYLEPQIARAPVKLPDLYELMWWLNFSLKWQAVTIRIDASAGEWRYRSLRGSVLHFFQTRGFQQWAMTNPHQRVPGSAWERHKWPLKEIIFDFTGDRKYRDEKLKVPSLGGTLRAPAGSAGLAIDASQSFLTESLDATLEKKQAAGSVAGLAAETDYDAWREMALWTAIKGHSE